jgi:SAM-dependent methyltransferase
MKDWEVLEDEKYSHLYDNGYPHGNPIAAIKWAGISQDTSVLDVGCGRGELSKFFTTYTGADVSASVIELNKNSNDNGTYIHSSLGALKTPSKVDLVACLDVLEHIPETQVWRSLKHMATLNADQFLFSISTRESVHLDKDGNNLHLTLWSMEKWITQLEKYFDVISTKEMTGRQAFFVTLTSKNNK